jgi:hypothetical protein
MAALQPSQSPQFGPHRVEAAVVLFPLTVDRGDAYWTVAYGGSLFSQSVCV